MTTKDSPLMKVVMPVRLYLDGQLPALQLVKIVDDLVSNDLLAELEPAAVELVDALHMALALYVPEEAARREEPRILIGPNELLAEVRRFEGKVRTMGL